MRCAPIGRAMSQPTCCKSRAVALPFRRPERTELPNAPAAPGTHIVRDVQPKGLWEKPSAKARRDGIPYAHAQHAVWDRVEELGAYDNGTKGGALPDVRVEFRRDRGQWLHIRLRVVTGEERKGCGLARAVGALQVYLTVFRGS